MHSEHRSPTEDGWRQGSPLTVSGGKGGGDPQPSSTRPQRAAGARGDPPSHQHRTPLHDQDQDIEAEEPPPPTTAAHANLVKAGGGGRHTAHSHIA